MPIREFARHQPGVTECCHITGEKDVLIKASFASVGAVEALVNRITQYGNVTTSVVLSSSMNDYLPPSPHVALDHFEPYLRTAFGFMGVDDLTVIRCSGGTEADIAASLARAEERMQQVIGGR